MVDDTWGGGDWLKDLRRVTTKEHQLVLDQIAKFVHELLIPFLLVHPLPPFHPFSNKGMRPIKHHPLLEAELGLSLRLQLHRAVIQLIEHFTVLFSGLILGGRLLEDVLLRVEEDVKVREVEALVKHFLDLFLCLGRQLATINIFSELGVVVDLRARIIGLAIRFLVIRGDIIFKQGLKDFFHYPLSECAIPAFAESLQERTQE